MAEFRVTCEAEAKDGSKYSYTVTLNIDRAMTPRQAFEIINHQAAQPTASDLGDEEKKLLDIGGAKFVVKNIEKI